MNILKNIVVNIKNKVLSLPSVINRRCSKKLSGVVGKDNFNVEMFCSKEIEFSKEEMSSLTFEHICRQMSYFNLKVDMQPHEWNALFGVLYDHLASIEKEQRTERLVATIFSDLLMNRYAFVNRIENNTITFELIFNWLDHALCGFEQFNDFYGLTANSRYKIKNRIRMCVQNYGKCDCSELVYDQPSSPTKCLVYDIGDYQIKRYGK